MGSRKTLGEKLAMLVKTTGRTQSELADSIGMPVSQLNRFLNGHSDLNAENLSNVLAALGINLDEIVTAKIRKQVDVEGAEVENVSDCINFLFRSLDEMGQQTYLKSLAWAARISSKDKLPNRVEEVLKNELRLI